MAKEICPECNCLADCRKCNTAMLYRITELAAERDTLKSNLEELKELHSSSAFNTNYWKGKAEDAAVEQAAVIGLLKSSLIRFGLHKLSCDYVEKHHGSRFGGSDGVCDCGFSNSLTIPTDSKQVLSDWLDSVLGEPSAVVVDDPHSAGWTKIRALVAMHSGIKLFKKPEIK
mgnify:CR=1 FL=1